MSRLNRDQIRYYLTLGVAAAKNDEFEQARHYLERVLRMYPEIEPRIKALLWLSQVAEDDVQRRAYLEQILAFDPANPEARRGLALLDGRLTQEEIVTPEQAAEASANGREPEDAPTRRFVCPNCGGTMRYDPARARLVCQYCGHSMTQAQALRAGSQVSDSDFITSMAKGEGHRWQQTAYSVQCGSCGATTVLPQGEISGNCPFCDSPQVVEVDIDEDVIEPHGIIPFRLTKEAAAQRFKDWLGTGWFRPDDLVRKARAGNPRGIYIPYWVFDFIGTVKWTALVTDGEDWTPTAEAMSIFEDNIMVPATQSLPAGPLHALDEFDLVDLEPYTPEKIASWSTEVYQISMSDASIVARTHVREQIEERIITRNLAGRAYKSLNIGTHMVSVDRFQHLLLPVWVISYRYGEQTYHVLVNGQSGEVEGEAPTNRGQAILLAALAVAVIAVFIFLAFLIVSSR